MIRRATVYDIPAMTAMMMAHIAEEGSDIPLVDNPEDAIAAQLLIMLNDDNCFAVVLVSGDSPVGMMLSTVSNIPLWMQPFGVAFALYILPEHRGGRKVLDLIGVSRKWMTLRGAQYAVIATRGKNENRKFYERLGFVQGSVSMTMPLLGPGG